MPNKLFGYLQKWEMEMDSQFRMEMKTLRKSKFFARKWDSRWRSAKDRFGKGHTTRPSTRWLESLKTVENQLEDDHTSSSLKRPESLDKDKPQKLDDGRRPESLDEDDCKAGKTIGDRKAWMEATIELGWPLHEHDKLESFQSIPEGAVQLYHLN